MQEREETFTIKVEDGATREEGEQAFLKRAKDLSDLIARFSQHVPDVNLTFTRHDQPACQLDWFHKERMIELAQMGECEPSLPDSVHGHDVERCRALQIGALRTFSHLATPTFPTGLSVARPTHRCARSRPT